jgi:hypothetical protein
MSQQEGRHRLKLLYQLAAVLMLSGCSEDARTELSYYCGNDLTTTVNHSSAVIYGADTPPPATTGVFPIDEAFLRNIDAGNPDHPTLVATDREGTVYVEHCDKLCDAGDALSLISECRDIPGCQIVGGVKNSAFYPFYTSDRNGGHLCSRNWPIAL